MALGRTGGGGGGGTPGASTTGANLELTENGVTSNVKVETDAVNNGTKVTMSTYDGLAAGDSYTLFSSVVAAAGPLLTYLVGVIGGVFSSFSVAKDYIALTSDEVRLSRQYTAADPSTITALYIDTSDTTGKILHGPINTAAGWVWTGNGRLNVRQTWYGFQDYWGPTQTYWTGYLGGGATPAFGRFARGISVPGATSLKRMAVALSPTAAPTAGITINVYKLTYVNGSGANMTETLLGGTTVSPTTGATSGYIFDFPANTIAEGEMVAIAVQDATTAVNYECYCQMSLVFGA